MPENARVVLVGPTLSGKTSLLATMAGAAQMHSHGYAHNSQLTIIPGSTAEGWGFYRDQAYDDFKRSFFDSRLVATVPESYNYDFEFDLTIASQKVRVFIIDTAGQITFPQAASDYEPVYSRAEFDKKLQACLGLIITIPCGDPQSSLLMPAFLDSLSSLRSKTMMRNIAIAITKLDLLEQSDGRSKRQISASTARRLTRLSLQSMTWLDRLRLFDADFDGNCRIRFIPTSAYGFQSNRPFHTADPFVFAATGLANGYMMSLREILALARPEIDKPPAFPHVPSQAPAPVRVEIRNERIAAARDADDVLLGDEKDFLAWREPIVQHIAELLAADFRKGTNHGRARERLLALETFFTGAIPEMKERQFRIGYEVQRLEALIAAYRSDTEDMPILDQAVLEDLDGLRLALQMGMGKFERWAAFQVNAMSPVNREGETNPPELGEALEDIAAKMDRRPEYFDASLPASFRFVLEALRDPVGATKVAAYGAVKSIENLFSFLGRTALGIGKGATKGVETLLSKAVATSLIIAIGDAALRLSGVYPQWLGWLKGLLEFLKRAG
jgi:energy-coupling factor transporter ATP-binding protein EcfA2